MPPAVPLAVVRVVGPPGSGKTLLITALVEALRSRGHLVATSAARGPAGGAGEGGATVITMSNGGRVTVGRALDLEALRALVPTLDPRAAVLLAEAVEEAGAPAIEIVPPGEKPSSLRADLIAIVSLTPSRDIATFGPEQAPGLADLIAVRLREQRTTSRGSSGIPKRRGLFERLRGRS